MHSIPLTADRGAVVNSGVTVAGSAEEPSANATDNLRADWRGAGGEGCGVYDIEGPRNLKT